MVRSTLLLGSVAALACSTFAFRGTPEVALVPQCSVACPLVALPRHEAPRPRPSAPAATEISAAGLQLIKELEGFVAEPHWDHSQWSIGYGARSETPHGTISAREAAEALCRDAVRLSRRIAAASRVPLSQAQLDALTSFAYNVGAAALLGYGTRAPSTLWRCVQDGDVAAATKEFLRWNRAGGRELTGLTKRRQREADLFACGPC